MLPGRTISATEASIHFGELLMSARMGPVLVERQGKPVVAVMSAEHYEGLTGSGSPSWQDWDGGAPCVDARLVIRQVAAPDETSVHQIWDAWGKAGTQLIAPALLMYEVSSPASRGF